MSFKRLCIIICAMIVVMVMVNHHILKYVDRQEALEEQKHVIAARNVPVERKASKVQRKWTRKNADPAELAKYGITLTYRGFEPETTEEWERFLEENSKKFKTTGSCLGAVYSSVFSPVQSRIY